MCLVVFVVRSVSRELSGPRFAEPCERPGSIPLCRDEAEREEEKADKEKEEVDYDDKDKAAKRALDEPQRLMLGDDMSWASDVEDEWSAESLRQRIAPLRSAPAATTAALLLLTLIVVVVVVGC